VIGLYLLFMGHCGSQNLLWKFATPSYDMVQAGGARTGGGVSIMLVARESCNPSQLRALLRCTLAKGGAGDDNSWRNESPLEQPF